ncbi:uncharacterized protein LOC112171630 [Rosa chinensis]|uniref:uncharacterized protein LOC112171630 n=1 Tax=Rosa chinensis TaxID=74649 RepID=UPI000D088448|nr:uncharacterized protein LOC112171630 [Rosa chinensis]
MNTNSQIASNCFSGDSDHLDAISWLNLCSGKLSKTVFDQLLFFLWGIWKERNARVWENKITSACDIALIASIRLSNFIFHNTKPQSTHGARKILKWKCPPLGWLKANIDGAYNPVSGRAAIGFLVRDSQGMFLGAVGKVVTHVQSVEHVELIACREAVDYVLEHGLFPMLLETDCLVLKQQLCQEELQNSSNLGRLYEDLRLDLDAGH